MLITTIWKECLATYGDPYLFGERSMADAIYAPVITASSPMTWHWSPICAVYSKNIMTMPEMQEWMAAVQEESEDIDELDVVF